MKRLFTALFVLVLVVLGTPALVATLMYDGSGDEHMPTDLYTDDADAQQMIMQELKDSFDELETDATEDIIFNLHEDIINVAIFNAIREENPEYMPTDDCSTPEQCYVVAEQQSVEGLDMMLRVVGAWVDFSEDTFKLNVFLEVELNEGLTYKTIVSTTFEFNDIPGKYVLEFKELRIGKIPLPASAISSILGAIEDNISEVNLDDLNQDMEVGELDLADFSYTIQKDEIVDLVGEDDPSAETDLVKEVISIIFDQGLVKFEFVEDEFIAYARLSKFESEDVNDIPDYLYDLHTVDPVSGEVGEFDPTLFDSENYLKDLFTEYIFNYALAGGNGFEITEETFNKLIYAQAGGFVEQRSIQELELGDGEVEEIEIGLKSIWFEITPEAIYANALIRVASVDSNLVITATKVDTESTATELVFEFTNIAFGKDSGELENEYLNIDDLEPFKNMFAELGDIEFGEFDENGTLTISAARLSALMQDGSNEGTVDVTGISIIQGAIVLEITPASELAQVLNDFSTALSGVVQSPELLTDLEGVLDTTTPGPEQDVYNSVQDLQTTLNGGGTPTPEEISDLFDGLEDLDEETQQEFLDTIEGLIDPSVLANYEGSFDPEE